jgi:two-component system, chemotaxis family, sensor kinase Cph1
MSSEGISETKAPILDLTACDREPIRIPGHIQPHGILIAIDNSALIRYLSINAEPLLSVTAHGALGAAYRDIVADEARDVLDADLRNWTGIPQVLQTISVNGTTYNIVGHRAGDLTILEFEEISDAEVATLDSLYPHLRTFVDTLQGVDSAETLSELVASRVRTITGFDRVMVYRFDADWNGTVIAEDRNDRLPSYLDLRFPAADIPSQARELYRTNRQRLIADAAYEPIPVLSIPGSDPLDMSFSVLRSVSPVHVEYMQNMGTASSMSISILVDGRLWGLISCHSEAPRLVPFPIRAACDFLGQMYSMQLLTRERSVDASERVERQAIQSELLSFMAGETQYMQGVLTHPDHLQRLTDADGVAVVFEERVTLFGVTPNEAQVWKLAEWLSQSQPHDRVFATSHLSGLVPDAAAFAADASGMVAISTSQLHPSYVMWFRKEVVQTVKWGGNPEKPTSGRLNPRLSFDVWKETVQATSLPWTEPQLHVAETFRNAIIGIVMRKAEEMAVLTDELRQSNKELEAFSYSVSHDLRAPFRHIVGYAELLKEEEAVAASSRSLRYVDTIIESAFSAGKLVDDLLSFSQMSRATVAAVKVDMNRLTKDVLRILAPSPEIEWQIEQLLPAWGDPNMLRQVLQNLIENAIKYSRKSEAPRIRIWSEVQGAEIIYAVRDNGVGFDMAYVDKLYGVFQRLHRMEEYEGTGIGLANVRRIIERHRGRAWAEGQVGQGATFYFSLPRTAKD